MTQEDKLKEAKRLYLTANADQKYVLESLFHELRESEGERIRKALIEGFNKLDKSAIWYNGITNGQILTWLEKQGRLMKALQISNARIGELIEENYYLKEKQGEQKPQGKSAFEAAKEEKLDNQNCVKPADKVEPKFYEGEWIIHQGTENIYQVVAIIDNQYQLKYGDNYTTQYCEDVDRCTRLWNVAKDAKDGDVLCDYSEAYDNPLIFILKKFECVNFGLTRPSDYSSYCFLTAGDIQRFKEGTYHHKHNIEPATKEQRDTLERAMTKAGYRWDKEKLKLEKYERSVFATNRYR